MLKVSLSPQPTPGSCQCSNSPPKTDPGPWGPNPPVPPSGSSTSPGVPCSLWGPAAQPADGGESPGDRPCGRKRYHDQDVCAMLCLFARLGLGEQRGFRAPPPPWPLGHQVQT